MKNQWNIIGDGELILSVIQNKIGEKKITYILENKMCEKDFLHI